MHDGLVTSERSFSKWKQLMEILPKKLKTALSSNSDAEPPMQGQYIRHVEALLVGPCDLSEEERRLNPANDTAQNKHQENIVEKYAVKPSSWVQEKTKRQKSSISSSTVGS